MNFFNRAWKNVTRKWSRSVLLCLTFFVIGNLVIIGLGISSAADNAKVLTRKQMRAVVSYEVDSDAYYDYVNSLESDEAINEAYNNYPTIDLDTVTNMAKDPRVKAVNYSLSQMGYLIDAENVPVGNEEQNSFNNTTGEVDENGNSVGYVQPNISISTNAFPTMIEMEEGTFSIVNGSFYTQDDIDNANMVCLITQELASQNNLSVGDTLKFSNVDPSQRKQIEEAGIDPTDLVGEFTIKGIYSTTQDVDPNGENFKWLSPYESPKNVVLIPTSSFGEYMYGAYQVSFEYAKTQPYFDPNTITLPSYEQITAANRAIFLLDDPLEVENFVSDYQNSLKEYMKLNANNDTFKQLARPLDTLSFFGNLIVGIVVLNAVIIISLVTALTLKTREYEIGVLLSMGVSKVKVVLQLFAELIIVAFLGFTLSVASGSLIAGRVGDAVLQFQQSQDDTDINSDNNYFYYGEQDYFTSVTQEDLLSQYHVSVDWKIILTIYVMGVAVVFIAIVIPSAMIMRLNPKQILLQ